MKYTIVDVETTGLSARNANVIEIAALKVIDGRIEKNYYHSLVNPGFDVGAFTTRLTGITNKQLRDAPSFYEIAEGFLDFLKDGSVFVAHNARFDESFINEELKRNSLEKFANEVLCTIRYARKVVPGLPSYSLENLIKHFQFEHKKNHRALDDVRITARLFLKLLELENGRR